MPSPRDHVLTMARTCKMDEPYQFEIEGNEADAYNFVHRMRVALSQIRDELKSRGKKPKKFKVINKGIEHNPRTGKSTITLVMARSTIESVLNEIEDTFNAIEG